MLASFFITDPGVLDIVEQQWSSRDADHAGHGRSREQLQTDLPQSGEIVLFDPAHLGKGWLARKPCPTATGMQYVEEDATLYVGSGDTIRSFGRRTTTLENKLFSDIHSIERGRDHSLLVASTGIDAILEIDPHHPREQRWDWLATEHGYTTTPSGKQRTIDRSANYMERKSVTPDHTTHLNTAVHDGDGVLATLFHQGTIVRIDYTTGAVATLYEGLTCPHHIKHHGDGYLVADSRADTFHLFDARFEKQTTISGEYNWIQDVEPWGDRFIVADSNNERLVQVQNNNTIDEFCYGRRKISALETISYEAAEHIFGKG
jgi:hypothetical protein